MKVGTFYVPVVEPPETVAPPAPPRAPVEPSHEAVADQIDALKRQVYGTTPEPKVGAGRGLPADTRAANDHRKLNPAIGDPARYAAPPVRTRYVGTAEGSA